MRDAFYVAMGSQVLSIVTDGAWYLLLLVCAICLGAIWLRLPCIFENAFLWMQVPTIGCYKLWTSVLQPLMFNR